MIAQPKLLCSECKHENEAERVYCHHCGGRLDRSAAIPIKEKRVDTHKRVKRMFDPQRAKIRALFFRTCKTLLGAGAAAVLIQIALPPDVPPPTKNLVLVSQIRSEMENAVNRHHPVEIDLTEDQVNAYLSSALRTKKASLDKPLLDFERAFVALHEGVCAITIERSIFGYPFYAGSTYSVSLKNGTLVAAAKAGSIGRMPIHPALMQYANVAFSDVYQALDFENKLVRKFTAMELHDKRTSLSLAAN